jgi:transcriptional regulator with XRE-family HTH domain
MKISVQKRLELKDFFREKGITQAQLAVLTGAFRQNISAWLSGSGCIGQQAQQQLLELAKSLEAQGGNDGQANAL